ncbi:MAG: hypothetical protein RJA61_333 [Candidatus Parcubacteria bacterium]|jgi:dUTP pyrophosphatase
MKLKIKKLHKDAVMPKYAHEGDAGMDLFSVEEVVISPEERVQIKTGLAFEVPPGYAGLIWDKSGLSHKHGLKTLGGVFDAGYRGELLVGVINLSKEKYILEKGHKVAQMVIQKIEHPLIVEVTELSETKRGKGGFGSTGK